MKRNFFNIIPKTIIPLMLSAIVTFSLNATIPVVAAATSTLAETNESSTGSTYVHNFDTDGKNSSFFTITGSLSTSKGSVTYGDLTIKQCLKMESSTTVTFTATNAGTLTLVSGGTTSAVGKSIKVDGTSYTGDSNSIFTVDLEAGAHTITKGDSINLFYIVYSEDGSSVEAPTESTSTAVTETTTAADTDTEVTTVNSGDFLQSAAKINITADDISGDDNLKAMALSLPAQDGTIESGAYYVATNGSDANAGTKDAPFATLDYAIRKVSGGGTIYVRGGVYDQKTAFRSSGTADNYIKVKAYPGEKPIFEISSTGRIIDPNKNSYIYIDGLTLKAKADAVSGSTHGVEMTQGNHIIFRNMEIYNINVPDPTSSSVSTHAFNLYGNNASSPINNILIENCYIHDMETGWSEALTVNGNCEYVSVINCRIKDIGNIGLDFAGNFGACSTAEYDQARYCVARGNEVSGCISPNARSYGLYNDGGRDNIFDRNIVYGNSGGIEIGSEEGGKSGKKPVQNIQITNNLAYDNIEVGISVGGYSITNSSVGYVYNGKIYNNTIVNNGETDLIVNKSDNLDYRNNIIYSTRPTGESIKISFNSNYTTNLNFANNIYYSPNGESGFIIDNADTVLKGISNWIDTSGKFVDPLFESGYKLSANSPAISNADGSVATVLGASDLAGVSRVIGSLDNGCYEYKDSSVDTTETTTETTTTTTTETTTTTTTETTTTTTTEKTTESTTAEPTTETTSETTTEKPDNVVGDADNDGIVESADVQMILDFATGKLNSVTNSILADVNGDGKVTAYDAYLIGKIIISQK